MTFPQQLSVLWHLCQKLRQHRACSRTLSKLVCIVLACQYDMPLCVNWIMLNENQSAVARGCTARAPVRHSKRLKEPFTFSMKDPLNSHICRVDAEGSELPDVSP